VVAEKLLRHLVKQGIPVEEFMTRRFTLEEIFIHLTVEEEVLGAVRSKGEEVV
jgi:hypothetical protein